eukprot:6208609-Pleurochrysis_carterae.AAC.1
MPHADADSRMAHADADSRRVFLTMPLHACSLGLSRKTRMTTMSSLRSVCASVRSLAAYSSAALVSCTSEGPTMAMR